jgi:hypothetical protein
MKIFRLFGIVFSGCIILLIISLSSCKKPLIFSKSNLEFSTDTLVFDTVFTTIGSTTKQFKIYNPEKRVVRIDEIELMGGDNSPFRINVDGVKGDLISDIELEGEDSLFVFVEVTLQVNGQNLPMVIEDSIRFRTNGKDQYVVLAVWGQDAYFHYGDKNEGTWPNDKPHVIYNFAGVDSAKTLNIQPGTQIYMHKNAVLWVYKGTLNINGALNQEVVFQGDRLEQDYDDVSGQYYGIYFQEARPSSINYAIIKNGISGVHLYSRDNTFSDYTLTMSNTIIQNCARYGVFIYSGAKVKAENSVIHKNGNHALLVLEGGDFFFNHCNLLGYGTGDASTPAIGISNFYNDYTTGTQNIGSIQEGKLYNCVVYGLQTSELVFDTIAETGVTLNFDIRNCLIKREAAATESYYQNIIWNSDPLFNDIDNDDYGFPASSPLNGAANSIFPVFFDITGAPRMIPADIGAYEN